MHKYVCSVQTLKNKVESLPKQTNVSTAKRYVKKCMWKNISINGYGRQYRSKNTLWDLGIWYCDQTFYQIVKSKQIIWIHSLQEEYRPMFAKVLMPSDPRQLCAVPSKLWHGVGFMK